MIRAALSNDPHGGQPVLQHGSALNHAAGAVILLHGRGASASDILGLASEFYHPEIAYLAPEAAQHAWYPLSFLAPIEQNEPWLSSALKAVKTLLEKTVSAGIPLEKTIIAGFSQGACLASEFTARNPARYGGVIGYTGGLIGPPGQKFDYAGSLEGTPVFLGAGANDPHVPWLRVEETARVLSTMGAGVTLRKYPGMAHIINEDEIAEGRRMILSLVAG